MWVEFFGPPGVGKSTLRKHTEAKGWRKAWPPSDWRSLKGLMEASPAWAEFVSHFMDVIRYLPRDKAAPREASFRRKMGMAVQASTHTSRWLLDDFACQRGQSLRAAGAPWEAVRKHFELVPLASGIIVLRADAATIKDRNRKRGHDLSAETDDAVMAVDMAIEVLRMRGANFLLLDTRDPVFENVLEIERFLDAGRGLLPVA